MEKQRKTTISRKQFTTYMIAHLDWHGFWILLQSFLAIMKIKWYLVLLW